MRPPVCAILIATAPASFSFSLLLFSSAFQFSAFQHFSISLSHFSVSAFQHFSVSLQHFSLSFQRFSISAFQLFSFSSRGTTAS
jgi:hypothetical protein